MKLLVVEDERMLCDTIAKSLHHAAMRWVAAMTGQRRWSGF